MTSTVQTKPSYCTACGARVPVRQVNCSVCGNVGIDPVCVRPTQSGEVKSENLSPPWDRFAWLPGGVVALWGGPGAGKSSLAAITRPQIWITSEQEPFAVARMFDRLGVKTPTIYRVKSHEEVLRFFKDARFNRPEKVVVDSLTAFGQVDSIKVLRDIVDWTQAHNARTMLVMQVTKENRAAGPMEISHEVDVLARAAVDKTGLRYLAFTKSRFSALETRYWIFNEHGQVDIPDFSDDVYSVEGAPGNYELVPFPVTGARWAGILQFLDDQEELHKFIGSASAAIRAKHKPSGFVLPNDFRERQAFAEAHGLKWINPSSLDCED
jgi:hypothetical protein